MNSCSNMKKLDKENNIANGDFEFNEGERTLLSSNEDVMRSPSLNFLDTSAENVSEEMILQHLAGIISAIYLKKICSKHKKIEQ